MLLDTAGCQEEKERTVVPAVLIDKYTAGRIKEWKGAGKPGQPGQLTLRSWGACPTNRPVCFHSFAGNICRAGPALPAEPENEWPAKIPAAHCFTCAARDSGRKNTHHSVKTAVAAARSFFPAAPVQAAKVHGPALSPRREMLCEIPGQAGGCDLGKELECPPPPRPPGMPALPGKACARHIKSGSHSPHPESAPGREMTQTQGDQRIKEGLPAAGLSNSPPTAGVT